VRFLPIFAAALWLPRAEGDVRWVALGMFLGALIWLLRGLEA